jgi:hypothetical protein
MTHDRRANSLERWQEGGGATYALGVALCGPVFLAWTRFRHAAPWNGKPSFL